MNNEEQKINKQTDEIGGELETGSEVNDAIEQQGDAATAGIPAAADAAKYQQVQSDEEQTE